MINSFLVSSLILLPILYIFQKWRNCQTPLNYQGKGEMRKWRFERFTHFKISIPFLDALYTFYHFRKYGILKVSDWMTEVGHNSVVEIPLGFFTLFASKNAEISLKMLKSPEPDHLCKAHVYHLFFADFLSRGLAATDYDVWIHQRKSLSRVFTFRHFTHYIKIMNKHSKNLVSDLLHMCSENGGIANGPKLHEVVTLNTQKITLEFTLGADNGDSKEGLEFAGHVFEFRDISAYRIVHPELSLPFVWRLHPKKKRLEYIFQSMNSFIGKVIAHHQKLSALLGDKDNEEYELKCLIEEMVKQNATPEEIYCQTGTFLIAGFETVVITMKYLIQHIASHPEYQARCRREVDNILGPYTVENDRDFTIDDLSKLEYTERVVNETMRITPVVPLVMRELKSSLKIDEECTLRKGIVVGVSPFAIHHNPRYYPHPEKFDPDRFSPEEIEKREPGTFIPFSAGMRNCIGKRFAIMEMKLILARLLRNFEIFTEDTLRDVRLNYEVVMLPDRDYRITLKRREFHGGN